MEMNNDDIYVTFEQAKSLKEKGYPQDLYSNTFWYAENRNRLNGVPPIVKVEAVCPTLYEVSKWLREEKNFHICPIYNESIYDLEINGSSVVWRIERGYVCPVHYYTYEEALSIGIELWLGHKPKFASGEYEYDISY